MFNQRLCLATLAIGMVATFPEVGQAYPITFQFAGIITSVDDPDNVLEGAVQTGRPFSGSYTFESTTPDSLPADPELGFYGPPGTEISMVIDTLNVAIPSNNSRITVGTISLSSGEWDYYAVEALPFQMDALQILEFGLSFQDNDGTVFNDDSLPTSPPDLDAFEIRQLRVQGERPGCPEFFIYGEVMMLPEPASLLLVLVGIAMITRRRERLCR